MYWIELKSLVCNPKSLLFLSFLIDNFFLSIIKFLLFFNVLLKYCAVFYDMHPVDSTLKFFFFCLIFSLLVKV